MGRKALFTDDEIIEVARALEAEGKPVNGWAIRTRLGDRGKPEYLEDVWKRHLEEGAAPKDEEPAHVTLPPRLLEHAREAQERLSASIQGLYVVAYSMVDADLRAKYKADFDRLATDREHMVAAAKDAEASISRADARIEEFEDQIETLQKQISEAAVAAARLEEQLRASQAALTQTQQDAAAVVRAHTEQVAVLEAERDAFAGAAQQANERAIAADAARQVTEATVATLTQQLTAAQAQATDLTGQLAAAQRAVVDLERREADLVERAGRRETELIQRADREAEQVRALTAGIAAAEARAATAEAQARERERVIERLEGHLSEVEGQLSKKHMGKAAIKEGSDGTAA